MSVEENKALVRRFYEEGTQNPALFNELLTPTIVLYYAGLPEPVRGVEARKHIHAVYLTAFPDLCDSVEDMIAEGDEVAVRLTSRGTQQGELQGIPPTGTQMTVPGMTMNRIADGKIVEEWVIGDALGLMQQLGVIPAPAQATA